MSYHSPKGRDSRGYSAREFRGRARVPESARELTAKRARVNPSSALRVWKGILGIRDLTKIQCGIRENAKYPDGIRDLPAATEAGFAKIWARDVGFVTCLSGIREIVTT